MATDPNEKGEKLKRACDQAYERYGGSCSHAVWHVISQYDPAQPYMQANQLIDRLTASAKWQTVEPYELSRLASQGILVVGGLKKTSGNGHVIVVYPGPEKPAGGYRANDRAGKPYQVRSRGWYALAMSTSIGHWPGAKSRGDKTVWDAWGQDAEFGQVKFWKYVGP
jgi:hypothetical protein